jgi:ketosteroid isomerase-like protein
MAQENVEVVRKAVRALAKGDVDGYLACCTDDVHLRSPLFEMEGAHEGTDGIRRLFVGMQDAIPDYRIDVERIEPVGPERVIAFLRWTGSGRTSGIPVDLPVAAVYDLTDGLIRCVRVFRDHQEALEAVGLSDSP